MQVHLFSPPAPPVARAPAASLSILTSGREALAETENVHYSTHETPFGAILIASTEKGICELHFAEAGNATENLLAALRQKYPKASLEAASLPAHQGAADFISGNRPSETVPLHLSGSSFQLQVWQALLEIPAGETRTYAQLAVTLGLPVQAARAVGSAVGQNAVAVLIPCHRVVGSSGKLSGFRWGVERKRQLLLAEMNAQ